LEQGSISLSAGEKSVFVAQNPTVGVGKAAEIKPLDAIEPSGRQGNSMRLAADRQRIGSGIREPLAGLMF
jgi:hypothetical protein